MKEAELQEEIQFHLDEEAEEREASGLPAAEAQRVARRELGNVARVQEDTRDAWGWTLLEQLLQDLRYAGRTMAANKTFTALAIVSLALGIGANTAIFSFMDSILLRSLPVSDPKSLVLLEWHTEKRILHGTNRHDDSYTDPNGGFVGGFFSYPAFEELARADRRSFPVAADRRVVRIGSRSSIHACRPHAFVEGDSNRIRSRFIAQPQY